MKRLAVWLACLCVPLGAAQSTSLVPGGHHAIVRLETTEGSRTHEFVVPPGLDGLFVALAHPAGVEGSLTAPGGGTVAPAVAEASGTQWKVPSPAAGTWAVVLTHDRTEARTVQIETFYNGTGAPRIGVIVPYVNIAGADVPVSVALFEGSTAIPGANVEVRVVSGGGVDHGTTPARDDGSASSADARAADGLYSSLLSSPPPGFYGARGTARLPDGTTLTTMQFFEVFGRTGFLDGTWSDAGEDRNGDGLVDAVVLEFGVDIERPGGYAVDVLLRASNGNELWTRRGAASLTTRSTRIRTEATADDLKERLGVDGPYEIASARLLWTPRTDGIVPRSHITSERTDLGHTRAYDLDTFDRPYLRFTRYVDDEGVDTNGNGLFDVIRVRFEVDSALDVSHPFVWNARLLADEGRPYEGDAAPGSGAGTIHPGLNLLTLEFPIDRHAVDGASGSYVVAQPNLYPPTALPAPYDPVSADELEDLPRVLGRTRPYAPSELDNGGAAPAGVDPF